MLTQISKPLLRLHLQKSVYDIIHLIIHLLIPHPPTLNLLYPRHSTTMHLTDNTAEGPEV